METETVSPSQAPSEEANAASPQPAAQIPDPPEPKPPRSRRDRLAAVNLPPIVRPERPPVAAAVDEAIAVDDLRLIFNVQIRGRFRPVFSQSRDVIIWMGAMQSGDHRYRASKDIMDQLGHMLGSAKMEMNRFTAEADPDAVHSGRGPLPMLPDAGSESPHDLDPNFVAPSMVARLPAEE